MEERVSVTQAANLEVISIKHRNDIKKTMWKTHRYFINFESQIDVELSSLN